MFKISRKTAMKATLAALISMVISLSVAYFVVPILGGKPEGVGFWMSAVLPLLIGWPASAYQFSQNEAVRIARDDVSKAHAELARMHDELVTMHSALQQRSRIDGLTGALNRETFMAQLQEASAIDRPSAVLIADADHFKQINDDFGHQCGDDALRGIARAIGSALRPNDFWGRIGGEEFAIYLNGVDPEMAREIADMVRLGTLGINLHSNDQFVQVSISIGGIWTRSKFDSSSAIAVADRRLYVAKRSGRNRVVMADDADRADQEVA
jgi:diguanylate cyclase (GGDEF)-like protein